MARVFLCCLPLLACGCSVSAPRHQPDARAHASGDISLNSEQIRRRVRAQVQPLSGLIVASADQIMAGTTDHVIRREALLWKLEAVPAVRESLFLPNPLAAILDAWVLTFQMTDYFENGRGATALGDASAVAAGTSRQLEAEVARIAASVTLSGSVADTREYARKLAAEHPLRNSITGRRSVTSLVTDPKLSDKFTTDEAVGSLVVTVDDLNRRLEIYSAQLLDQSRWQAELFAMDRAREYQLDKAMPLAEQVSKNTRQAADDFARIVPVLERSGATLEKALPLAESAIKSAGRAVDALDRTVPAVERSLAIVEKTPALIAAERATAIEALSAEFTRAIAFIQEERVAVLKQLTAERTAAVRDVCEAVMRERELLTRDIDAIALKSVDRAFLRATQLCAASLVVIFLGVIVLMAVARRVFLDRSDSGSQRHSDSASSPV